MGMPKTSRKGKKAWRNNISTADVDEYFVKTDKEARSGGPLNDVSSDSLFFIDRSKDFSIKRKIEKYRNKVLYCDSVLQNNPFVVSIPSSKKKQPKTKDAVSGKLPSKKAITLASSGKPPSNKTIALTSAKGDQKVADALVDIWDDKVNNNEKEEEDSKKKGLICKTKVSVIPAVEVEPPGCSFNPPFEAHQDALAVAVAQEMQKVYKKHLEPQPPPLSVAGEAVDEDDLYFLDVDDGNDEELDDGDGDGTNQGRRPLKIRKLTRAELNRKARRKAQLKIEAEQRKREKSGKDVDRLPDIMKDIQMEDEKKERRRLRCAVAKQERLAKGPPRLGRYKFKPDPLQVLLSEEVTGSIRKLKGCCTLARDRFKSLQKRGFFPTGGQNRRKARR